MVEVRRERCGSQVAVGRGGRGEDEEEAGEAEGRSGGAEERRSGRRQATDIKSNNPHLAGGEKNMECHDGIHIISGM